MILDDGKTSMLYDKRIERGHVRSQVNGDLDELHSWAAIILCEVRSLNTPYATTHHPDALNDINAVMKGVREELPMIMSEVACLPEDRNRFLADPKIPKMTETIVQSVKWWMGSLELKLTHVTSWSRETKSPVATKLDYMRALARRADRSFCLIRAECPNGDLIATYLNDLTHVIWQLSALRGMGQWT